tara:strand:- start:426 stop:2270 length:1845 start_codon:yes stop_codon:yes gene_type:complete
MANYTITGNTSINNQNVFRLTETIGDSVAAGNMAASCVLTITPDINYVVQASDFSIGDALPSQVQSVVFTNSGTANQPGNTVIATVNFVSSFNVTQELVGETGIVVDIDGTATYFGNVDTINVDVDQDVFDITNDTQFETTITQTGGMSVSTTSSSGINTTVITGQAVPNKSKKIAKVVIESKSGYYFTSQPKLQYFGTPRESLRLVIDGDNQPVRNADGEVTKYTFHLIYKNNVSTLANSGNGVLLVVKTQAIKTIPKKIIAVSFGSSQVTAGGEERVIKIQGTKDAEFNLTITDDTDKKSILDGIGTRTDPDITGVSFSTYSDLTETTVLNPVYGSIDAINKKFTKNGFCTFKQTFPAYSSTILTTAINMGGGLSGTTATFDALTNVRVGDRLKMDTISTGDVVTVVSLNSSTEAVLSQSVTAANDAVAVFTRDQKYFINLFPVGDTTLASNIPTEEPHYTINQYMDPVLKLTVSETDGGYTGPTTVYTKTGRANKQPHEISHTQVYSSGTTSSKFSISYSITADGGKSLRAVGSTSGIPTWSSTDASSSMWTNSVSADNGGTQIEIENIKMAGLPSGAAGTITLTADVIIHKWGTEDVTMNLDLDQIIETH